MIQGSFNVGLKGEQFSQNEVKHTTKCFTGSSGELLKVNIKNQCLRGLVNHLKIAIKKETKRIVMYLISMCS